MFESHHNGRLFPNIQKLPGLKPHIDVLRAEEIQCKNKEAVYLYACVQFGIGSFQRCTPILNISYISLFYPVNKSYSSAMLRSKDILTDCKLYTQNGHF